MSSSSSGGEEYIKQQAIVQVPRVCVKEIAGSNYELQIDAHDICLEEEPVLTQY